ncbi:MAG: CoB--CoM heterodisulfide reductase iron-sulfur subunit A family protein [Promethearchaeota archaeon]|nr:MAG: CoB--CoM heterodisulfide reductase iron-sulfur subunit A family protein [Candidatus Lokiarchaeota archaeon]
MDDESKSVLVIGGGIAGIQASLDLAERGIKVELVEKDSCIGGRMAQLDKTFPTNDCSICILAPKLAECFRHPNITLHTLSEVEEISGEAGNFKVKVLKKARYVKEDICNGCGDCAEICPVRGIPSNFDVDLRSHGAIYIAFPSSVPLVYLIDDTKCLYFEYGICGLCAAACGLGAIDFSEKDEELEFNVGSIIIATGYDVFDASLLPRLGYGRIQNVVSGLEFERLICASGPLNGHLVRPSDKKDPKKLAFINCVGSRDIRNNPYCSTCCCMYTTKGAMIAHEHDNEIESTIFYIDLRASGKDFQKYLKRGKEDYNITYIKGKVTKIIEDKEKNPIVIYEDINSFKIKQDTFDMVILAASMVPKKDTGKLAETIGVELDKYNFFKGDTYHPQLSSKKGIFLCGACREPMDIPTSVVDASGAAARAAETIMRR